MRLHAAAVALLPEAMGITVLPANSNVCSTLGHACACRSVPSTPTWVREESVHGSGYDWTGPVGWHCVRPSSCAGMASCG